MTGACHHAHFYFVIDMWSCKHFCMGKPGTMTLPSQPPT
jgi:hypothetical protein